MMRRRSCLGLLLALAAADAARAGSAVGEHVLDGPQGAWLLGATGLLQPLPHAVAPVAVDGALWTAANPRVDGGDGGEVQRWQRRPGGACRVVARRSLDAPVHALAASADGRHAVAAHGQRLTVLGEDAAVLAAFEGHDLAGRRQGRAEALFALAGRRSFVAAWPALGELWEISLDPAAEPIYDGLVHDYRMGEGIARPGLLGARRAPLGLPMPSIEFGDARLPWVAGRDAAGVAIVHLDVRRRVATLPLGGARPGAGALRRTASGDTWWLPAGDRVHVVDARRWTVLASLAAPATVQSLHAVGDRIAARAGDPAELLLWQHDRWQSVQGLGPVTALGSDAGAGHWLVVAGSPPVLQRLDRDGRPLSSVALPAQLQITRVQALRA